MIDLGTFNADDFVKTATKNPPVLSTWGKKRAHLVSILRSKLLKLLENISGRNKAFPHRSTTAEVGRPNTGIDRIEKNIESIESNRGWRGGFVGRNSGFIRLSDMVASTGVVVLFLNLWVDHRTDQIDRTYPNYRTLSTSIESTVSP